MSESRAPVVIDQPPAEEVSETDEECIDLEDWVSGGDNVEKRLLKIAKQMELDALALPVGNQFRGQLLKDSAAIFSRLLDKQKPDAKKDGGVTVIAGSRGGVAVFQISRDDAADRYMKLIEGSQPDVVD